MAVSTGTQKVPVETDPGVSRVGPPPGGGGGGVGEDPIDATIVVSGNTAYSACAQGTSTIGPPCCICEKVCELKRVSLLGHS